MKLYIETILGAADQLASGRGLDYRERLRLERAVFRMTSDRATRAFGRPLQSMGAAACDQFASHCVAVGIETDDARFVIVDLGFEVMRLIASIANADPYVLNENISRILHRYSTGVATLPSILRHFVAIQPE